MGATSHLPSRGLVVQSFTWTEASQDILGQIQLVLLPSLLPPLSPSLPIFIGWLLCSGYYGRRWKFLPSGNL